MTKQEVAQKLAELQLNKDSLESEKKAVASDYTEKIKKIESEMSALAMMYLSEENKDQQDMFDGIEEAEHTEIITDESKLLNSGLELPGNVDHEETKTSDGNDFLDFGITNEYLDSNPFISNYGVIKNAEDLEKFHIYDYDSDLVNEAKGKLMIHFENEKEMQKFITGVLVGRLILYSRFGNYILIAPVTEEVGK